MNEKEMQLMFALLRQYTALRSDRMILMGIALESQSSGNPVSELARQLDDQRQLPYHQSQRQSTEQLLEYFGRTADVDALIRWIGETPKDNLPN
jgi:hypothetical protein